MRRDTEYSIHIISLRIQSECGEIQTRKNSVFGHFSRSAANTKQKEHITDANIFKIKDTNINKLRPATTVRPSVTETLFTNEFTSFPGCQTMESHIYYSIKAQALEVYSSNSESTISNIKSAAAVIDLSTIACAEAAVQRCF